MHILSTNILTKEQRNILVGYTITEDALIEISFLKIDKLTKVINAAIFTSKNAVKSVFEINKNTAKQFNKVYCVGEKTAKLLKKQGIEPLIVSNSAKNLAVKLLTVKENFVFFCGTTRRKELLEIVPKNGIKEIEVYKTILKPKKYTQVFDIILFYSPTGIQSYIKEKNNTNSMVICIGNTTASEAKKHFKNVYIAKETSIESVLEKVIELDVTNFKNNTNG